jgi:2-polyprenyl-3-methyl-5-hydroxy-6-metoxy-1,4-benzoquinol methylase
MIDTCPVCASQEIDEFLHIPAVPVHCNRLWDSYSAAVAAPRGEIRLVFCLTCCHVFNQAFDPSLVEYDPEYENSLFFSPRFRQYAQSLAVSLVRRYDLHRKTILEVGSGTGEFLRLLCELGENDGLGFDPSYGPEGQQPTRGSIQYFPEFFTRDQLNRHFDFGVCRHVLEHLDQPGKLLDILRVVNSTLFFEVPNAIFTLRDLGVWDIIYEHFSYYTPVSLIKIFQRGGYGIQRIADTFNGQFLTIEAIPSEQSDLIFENSMASSSEIKEWVAAFSGQYQRQLAFWDREITKMRAKNQRVVVWGAGSKGITFLNALPTSKLIKFIVDINPRKLDRYIPGAGQKIVAPEFLKALQPDTVILMNPNYQDEIRIKLDRLSLSANIILG